MSDHPVAAAYAGVFLFIIGVAIGVGALEVNRRERDRLQGWLRADGTVVTLLAGANGTRPQVAFSAANGERVSFTLQQSSGRQFVVGRLCPSLYWRRAGEARRIRAHAVDAQRAGRGTALILMALGGYVAWYARQWDAPTRLL